MLLVLQVARFDQRQLSQLNPVLIVENRLEFFRLFNQVEMTTNRPPRTSAGPQPVETVAPAPVRPVAPPPPAAPVRERAVLDSAHVGDIQGAFGTIRQHDTGAPAQLARARCSRCSRSSDPG